MSIRKSERTSDAPADLGAFSVKQFATMFGLSRGMAYKLRDEGKLRITKIGARSVITVAEAKRFQRALESDAA
jgi:Helix-turn-helix domain